MMVDENGFLEKKDLFVTIRKAFDNEDYDRVRERLYASKEGAFKEIHINRIIGRRC